MTDSKTQLLDCLSQRAGRDWLTPYADGQGLTRHAALQQVADHFGYPLISLERLNQLTPQFDQVPYDAMLAQRVLMVRDEHGACYAVMGEPIDQAPRAWVASLDLDVTDIWLADPLDVEAMLDRYATSFSAVASAVSKSDQEVVSRDDSDELTLVSIANEPSP
ncbi:hypothetical protein, partial [Chitinimonas sp.]|uniref:GspE/PulE/PilB domain-containing protein n=1 Tax=Chitinimonas sp. TaxID=1934313 RepID=UPI0035B0F90C